jgi:hypothetical protein
MRHSLISFHLAGMRHWSRNGGKGIRSILSSRRSGWRTIRSFTARCVACSYCLFAGLNFFSLEQILNGEREPRFVEYTCPEHGACGGLADRMMGMVTTFLYAVASNRAISLTWEQPLPLDMIFDSPFVDWSNRFLPAPSPARHPIYDNQTLINSRLHLTGHVASSESMFSTMTQLLHDEKTKEIPFIQVRHSFSSSYCWY